MIPEPEQLVSPALLILSREGTRTFRLLRSELEDQFGLTPDEKARRTESDDEYLMSNHLHRALGYMVRDGLVIKLTRDDYQLTEKGTSALAGGSPEVPL